MAGDAEHWHYTQHYRDVAERVKTGKQVDQIVQHIEEISRGDIKENPFSTPFVLIETSSGTGKTQMAFNLMARHELEVFYIACGEPREDVQLAYSRRSGSFMRCIARDVPAMSDSGIVNVSAVLESYTCGFIWALLTGNRTFAEPQTREKVGAR